MPTLAEILAQTRQDARDGMDKINKAAPKEVHDLAAFLAPMFPGYSVMDSMRLGREAAGLWRMGDYPGSIDRFADAMAAPAGELYFLLPGSKKAIPK